MKKLTVAFDVDDCLVKWAADGRACPNHNIIDLLRWFQVNGHDVIVWSGGGVEYAQTFAEKFNLGDVRVVGKGSEQADIAIDDMGGDEDLFYTDKWNAGAESSILAKVIIRV